MNQAKELMNFLQNHKSTITLLTDFGISDNYVGIMKGVILSLNPLVQLVDLCHNISPQDIRAGAYLLGTSYHYFPANCICLAVVDPGVGSCRRGLIVKGGSYLFVGPDNGLFTMVYEQEESVETYEIITPKDKSTISSTFHGRDIFAPIAARLSLGIPCDELGAMISNPIHVSGLSPKQEDSALKGEIIHVDRFGNLISNITRNDLERFCNNIAFNISLAGINIDQIKISYSDALPGKTIALFGSTDRIEISVAMGNAARIHGVREGAPIIVSKSPTPFFP